MLVCPVEYRAFKTWALQTWLLSPLLPHCTRPLLSCFLHLGSSECALPCVCPPTCSPHYSNPLPFGIRRFPAPALFSYLLKDLLGGPSWLHLHLPPHLLRSLPFLSALSLPIASSDRWEVSLLILLFIIYFPPLNVSHVRVLASLLQARSVTRKY